MNTTSDDMKHLSDLVNTYAKTLQVIAENEEFDRFTLARLQVSVAYLLDAAETVEAVAQDLKLQGERD